MKNRQKNKNRNFRPKNGRHFETGGHLDFFWEFLHLYPISINPTKFGRNPPSGIGENCVRDKKCYGQTDRQTETSAISSRKLRFTVG